MLRILRRLPRSARRQFPNAVSLALTFSLLVSSVPLGPLPAQAAIADLTQEDYRWYANIDAVQPTAALAAENTSITGQPSGTVYQLRMALNNSGNNIGSGVAFKLQFSTAIPAGPWTDVGAVGSGPRYSSRSLFILPKLRWVRAISSNASFLNLTPSFLHIPVIDSFLTTRTS